MFKNIFMGIEAFVSRNTSFFLVILWIVGLSIFIGIAVIIFVYPNSSYGKALSGAGILVSAFIASVSVLKSIEENKKIALDNRKYEENRYEELFTLRMEEMSHAFFSGISHIDWFEKSENKVDGLHHLELVKSILEAKHKELSEKDVIHGLYVSKRKHPGHGIHVGKVTSFVMMRNEIFDGIKIIDNLIEMVLKDNGKRDNQVYSNYCGSIKIRLYSIKSAVETSFDSNQPLRDENGHLI